MFRINPIVIAFFCTVAACSPAPEPSAGGRSGPVTQTASQDEPLSEITAETIERDVIGHVVTITGVENDSTPTDWTFDADEFRQAEILERKTSPVGASITVFITTRNNPGPNEELLTVSGKLRLYYQRKGGEWVVTTIENLTFCYRIDIST
jgi:hypothetical protein